MALGPWITEDDKRAVMAVLDAGDLMSGKRVAQLEEELAAYFCKRHCVCVSSGTAALECAFVATGEGDRIRPEGFVAILSAARAAGKDPKPARRLRAVDGQYIHGVGTDVLGVQCSVETRVHDCAHRFDKGAAHAEVSCFSFAPNKFIACGGGCLITNDSVAASIACQYRNHGRDGGPEVYREGRNLRMGEINAALALSQLKRIDEILARRQQVAKWYDEYFSRVEQYPLGFVGKFEPQAPLRESHFLYPVWWPSHKQRSLADFRLFNTATQEDRDTALYPICPMMTREEVEAICKS